MPADRVRHDNRRMQTFIQTILFTGTDGYARFREEPIALDQGKPMARLSALMPSGGYQLRHSPVGFRSEFHCTDAPQWVFILGGQMEIGLRDGSSRVFSACPRGRCLMTRCTATGAASWAQIRW
jgi:hypothetical protein